MKVADVMATNLRTCPPGAALADVAEMAAALDLGTVPITDQRGKLLGVITQRDLCRLLQKDPEKLTGLTARDILRTDEPTCAPGENVREVLCRLRQMRVRQMPVLDREGRLLGMLSLSDLILFARHEPAESDLSDLEVMRVIQAISACRCTSVRSHLRD